MFYDYEIRAINESLGSRGQFHQIHINDAEA